MVDRKNSHRISHTSLDILLKEYLFVEILTNTSLEIIFAGIAKVLGMKKNKGAHGIKSKYVNTFCVVGRNF